MERLPLGSVRTFAVVARVLSITKAAEQLSVTPSAVSHQIKVLEGYLGTALFEREKNRLHLTPEGRHFLSQASEALSMLSCATRTLKTRKPHQTLRIGSTPSFAQLWLIPRLARFSAAHPNIAVAVTGIPDPAAVQSDCFDVAVWYGSGGVRERATEPLGTDRVFPICNRSGVHGTHCPATPADLTRCTLLDSADDIYHRWREPRQPSWTEWLQAAGLNDVAARKYLFFTPRVLMHSAVAAGLGVGLSRSLLAVDAIESGTVVVPFGPVLQHANTYNLVYPRHYGKRKDVAAFREWIHHEAAKSNQRLDRLLGALPTPS